MTSDPPAQPPSQPLTDAELSAIRGRSEATEDPSTENSYGAFADSASDVPRLLAEVDRLRAELAEVSSARDYLSGRVDWYIDLCERTTQRWENADAEITAQAAKIKRLETERAALVRKLGFDWGPDEFGDLSAVPDKECTCHPTDPSTWTTYGSAVEPGSMFEPNPDCPRHK